MTDLLLIPCSVFEEDIYGHSTLVLSAIFECFNQIGHERQKLTLDEFLLWCTKSPFCLSWLFTFHRLMSSEYNVNLSSCSNCGVAPFLGFRYVALHRYTVAICQECMWTGNCEETEFREFGALSQCVNVTVVPMKTVGSTTSIANSNTLSQVHQCLDKRHSMLLTYSKRLDPKSTSHFVSLYETVQSKDDNLEAFIGECEDRALKLQRDFHVLCKEHSEILKLERKDNEHESFIAWQRRDDMASRLAIWMSRRNDLYIKQESILRSEDVPLPTVCYAKFGALGSLESVVSGDHPNENNIHVSMNGIDLLGPKVSVEDSVMVLSKLSLIINDALLQKSFSSTPSKPLKQMSRDTPPMSPLSFENKAASVRITNGTNGLSKDNNTPSSLNDTAMTSSEKDVMKEFEDTVNDIMIQENLIPPSRKIIPLYLEGKGCRLTSNLEAIAEIEQVAANKGSLPSDLGPLSSEKESSKIGTKTLQSECEMKQNLEKETPPDNGKDNPKKDLTNKASANSNVHKNPKESSKPSPKSSPLPPQRTLAPVLKPPTQNKTKVTSRIPVPRKITPPEPTSVKTESPVTSLPDLTVEATPTTSLVTVVKEEEQEETEEQEEVKEEEVEEKGEDEDFGKIEEEEEEVEDEWESEGSWETEDDNTERSQPPDSLNLAGVVSEPECDPPDPEEDPEDSAPPIPPPRSLLSPQGVSRRATSLKTKSEGDPRMEELRKVTRASSSVHSKSKPSGIPMRSTPTIPGSMPTLSGTPSPANTPPPRLTTRLPTPKNNTPDIAVLSATPSSTPDILARISDHSARSTPEVKPRVAPRRGKPGSKPTTPFKGPIVYEGESDSETSTSSSSSSDDGKKSKFSRARSARFARTKATTPNRNAASFRTKKGGSKNQQPLEFFNSFAE
ncbi:proteoglycan 4-like [Bolinopsis microptera]|uniref:proteoglycan 4-like n=1 Tax=Bolinopsis microptera TaxID=2820187 RepID=UPI003078BAF8